MPEGPSIVILKELAEPFKGKEIIGVTGNTKIGKERFLHKTITGFKSWGKHFLIVFEEFTIRIHFLLFGTYRINEHKESEPRLGLLFETGELNFYACGMQLLEGDLDTIYDWAVDVMSDSWDPEKAETKIKNQPAMLACDALLNQDIFSGSGNIIKNEVLFRTGIHPESQCGKIPPLVLKEMIKQVRIYSFEFLEWKKAFVLKKHWLAHTKSICPRCQVPLEKKKLGKTNRRSFYCTLCQVLYN